MKDFHFVDNDKIDRKFIRSHVMKGKNTGKTRPRPAPPKHAQSDSSESTSEDTVSSSSSSDSLHNGDGLAIIERPLGDALGYFTFPSPMDAPLRNLMERFMYFNLRSMYPEEFCISMDQPRAKWFSYMQSSETFLHCALVMATIETDGIRGKPPHSPQALRHLANTYRCFNRDLQEYSVPTDPTLAVAVSLAVHENLSAHFGLSKVHLEALHHMLELRGGIEEVSPNWVLWHKFCRADIDRALHQCCDTLFYKDCLPQLAVQSTVSALALIGSPRCSSEQRPNIGPNLAAILDDINTFAKLLDQNPARLGMQPSAFQGALILFFYRLLQVYPLSHMPPQSEVENAMHITLLGLLTTVLFEYGKLQVRSYDLLAARLRNAVSGWMTVVTLKQQPMLLWMLFMAGIALLGPEDEDWLFPTIKSCLSALNINNWEGARLVIGRLPWIRVVHDRPAYKLWQAVLASESEA